jgi:short-subunit dehydrogenase
MKNQYKYGPWAVIAGASEGIGAAFATHASRLGLNTVLIGRRREPLLDLAATLTTQTRAIVTDLAAPDGIDTVVAGTADLEVGLVVANAAWAPIGRFIDTEESSLRAAIDLNCTATLRLARAFLPAMVQRHRGGFIIMSSMAGLQGSPGITTYAATKAFGAVLAEGLWAEMRGSGVDVLACAPGAVETPGLARSKSKRAPGTVAPDVVAAAAFGALGRRPRTVPGGVMKFAAVLTQRVLPRRTAISIIEKASGDLT